MYNWLSIIDIGISYINYIHPSLNVSKYPLDIGISIIDVYSCILAIQVSMDLG
jgi:hypothetical protein